jgi:signal transduction histidine kinase
MASWLRWPRTLSARLSVLVFALALPVFVIIAVSYADALRERRASELDGLSRTATDSSAILGAFIRDLDDTTFASAGLLATDARPLDQAGQGAYLASLVARYPEIRAYFITDLDGKVRASASGEGVGTDLSSRPYMAPLMAGAERVWSGSIVGLQSGDITVAFGRPIRAPGGAPRGFIITAFYPDRVVQLLRPQLPSDAQLLLIDERGKVLYDSTRSQPATAEIDVSSAPGVKEALAGRTVPIDDVATPLGTDKRFGALVPVRATGWVLALTRPAALLQSELYGRLLGDAVAVLATLAVAAVIATFIANRLARPLRELATVATSIARGDRPVIPQATEGDEVEQLSNAMRAMQAAVAKREDQLRLLASAGESLPSSLDLDEALSHASRVAIPGFADWVVIDVLEAGLISRAAVATADPEKEPIARRLRERFPPSQPSDPHGPISRSIALREPIFMTDVTDEFLSGVSRHPDELALYRQLAPVSFMTLPLLVGDRAEGAVTFLTAESGRRYTNDDLELGKQLARRMALSIENARLYYEVRQSVQTRDDFLSAVAHELKTPLTVISASTQMVQRAQRKAGDGAGPDPSLTRILGAVARMTAFIEELLELVRRQADPTLSLKRSQVDLAEVARNVVRDAGQLSHGQDLHVEASRPVIGEWDATRLERALGNLVGNAIKYNREGGAVIVRVGTEDTPVGPVAFCAVTDEGIGIPETDRARIFDRFTRGANVAGRISGSGVGLAIVRQVVEQHGGSVEVTSIEGRGSTFTVRLPLTATRVEAG